MGRRWAPYAVPGYHQTAQGLRRRRCCNEAQNAAARCVQAVAQELSRMQRLRLGMAAAAAAAAAFAGMGSKGDLDLAYGPAGG